MKVQLAWFVMLHIMKIHPDRKEICVMYLKAVVITSSLALKLTLSTRT